MTQTMDYLLRVACLWSLCFTAGAVYLLLQVGGS